MNTLLNIRAAANKSAKSITAALVMTLLTPISAFAHPGHADHSFFSGLTHPLTGVDHLIMLLAFGLLVGTLSFKKGKTLALLVAGVASLVVGLLAGKAIGYAAFIEPMIIASLFVMSVCLWHVVTPSVTKVNAALSLAIGLLFFHGYAHGVEAAANLSQFALGMTMMACMLLGAGCMAGRWIGSKWLSIGVASASVLFMVTA
ncbi:urease accessory protein UreJ [Vibrio halioticoli NBRC 102217]|uniref:Urease accessory protein UreJ n=1 Tax=Vibrio halioticoli NBRC 102217 TaxID=1219072 RepID=V5FC15_9VIBR|nr:HupE/UreJ family protein [Vibrio halioticoli]GAD88908.1 urease accessory protein UreJ [Vibrio halioticoli NBRC 102217]